MKKIILLLVFAILGSSVIAQDDDGKLYKGIRAGFQSSNIKDGGDEIDGFDPYSGFYVGIFGARSLGAGKLLSLYSGLTFYQTGTKQDDDNKIVLSYISIPVNLRVKVGPAYAFGGFNAAFKVGEDSKFGGQDAEDLLDISGFDAGAQIGIGAKISFIGAELKYNAGLVDIADGEDGVKTSHFQAGLCVYF